MMQPWKLTRTKKTQQLFAEATASMGNCQSRIRMISIPASCGTMKLMHIRMSKETIMSAIGCSSDKATTIVNSIHTHVSRYFFHCSAIHVFARDVLSFPNRRHQRASQNSPAAGKHPPWCHDPPSSGYFRENICGLLVNWLKDLVTGPRCFFPSLPNGDAILRTI